MFIAVDKSRNTNYIYQQIYESLKLTNKKGKSKPSVVLVKYPHKNQRKDDLDA